MTRTTAIRQTNLKRPVFSSDRLAGGVGSGYSQAMKIILALLLAVGLHLSLAAQTAPAGLATPGAKAGKDAKKEEPPPKIEGVEVSRGDKGFLGVQILNGTFKITFYDAEKKETPPDVARAALRWDPKYKLGYERIILTPGEPSSLSSPRTIRPPYNFKLFIVLLKDATDDGADNSTGETYVIDFRQ